VRTWLSALLVSVVVALVSVELLLLACLTWPAWAQRTLPVGFFAFVRELHLEYERSIVHFDPRFARYDAELFYALRPGAARFASREFDTDFRVNRAGLRDDDASLEAPAVIVIGDSFAMGWGVDQDEAFPQVLERLSGLRVLGAGVSSYGTVREMMLFDRLDTSALQFLVVQYHHSDRPENWLFQKMGDHLPISPPEVYAATVEHEAKRRRYLPGRYGWLLARHFLRGAESPKRDEAPVDTHDDAQLFVHALLRAGSGPPPDVRLIVLAFGDDARGFLGRLRAYARRPSNPPVVRELVTVGLDDAIDEGDFYVLDDHLRPSGHERVAEALASVIRSETESVP
jgi:hypothetical protein